MSVFITLFLIYIFIVMGLSMTESLLRRPSSRKHIRLKRPIFGKRQKGGIKCLNVSATLFNFMIC